MLGRDHGYREGTACHSGKPAGTTFTRAPEVYIGPTGIGEAGLPAVWVVTLQTRLQATPVITIGAWRALPTLHSPGGSGNTRLEQVRTVLVAVHFGPWLRTRPHCKPAALPPSLSFPC